MITNIFHKNGDLIGINIEKSIDGSFIVSIAYKVIDKWIAKTLSGISGDFDDEILINQVIKRGHSLDKTIALKMFSNISLNFADPETK